MKKGSFNIILVDWSALAALPYYARSVINSELVGIYLAKFIKFIVKQGVPMQNIHLIGFSLGAKVAGIAGKALSGKLPRITGKFVFLARHFLQSYRRI